MIVIVQFIRLLACDVFWVHAVHNVRRVEIMDLISQQTSACYVCSTAQHMTWNTHKTRLFLVCVQVGISQRPVRQTVSTLRPSPLLTMRAITPRFGVGVPTNKRNSTSNVSPLSLSSPSMDGTASPATAMLLPVRDNPHKLFIKEPPPSTSASPGASSLTPNTPATPPSQRGGDRDNVGKQGPSAPEAATAAGNGRAENGRSANGMHQDR